ncbi:MAG: endonuclease V, partial [Pseudomonadota bacterium]
ILATDVQYDGDTRAVAAGVGFHDWQAAEPAVARTTRIASIETYAPGAFYKRELPCLMALLGTFDDPPRLVIVDGFVTLGPDAHPGLGTHLFDALDRAVPVIGVAKNPFSGTPRETHVRRGTSRQPLYVTAIGLLLETAQAHIAGMHGPYRVPTLLRHVDRMARDGMAAWIT